MPKRSEVEVKRLSTICAALLAIAAASPAVAATRTYALVVGVNTSMDSGVPSLQYADDDAAKYARLFDGFTDETVLLTVFDSDSRRAYSDLAARAQIPDRRQLERALERLGRRMVEDHARGDQAVFYFVYTGHGAREKNGEGYVNLVDEKLTRTELHRLILSRTPSESWSKPDALHLIVDACSAYFLVHDRGGDLVADAKDFSAHLGQLFGGGTTPERYPHAGFLLATTGDVKVHEWSAYRSGVFSHLVRSALSGAADVDLDGQVTYAEVGAFIAAASGNIKDPRARIDVTVTAPPANPMAPLTERNRFDPRRLVMLGPELAGHFEVESEDGERVLDLHKAAGLPTVIALWGDDRFYLSSGKGESVLDFRGRTAIASAALEFGQPRRAHRGAIDEEYRRALFSRPFDPSFYEAYLSLLRLPVPSKREPNLPEEFRNVSVGRPAPSAAVPSASAPLAVEPRSGSGPGAWIALGSGLALGATSGLMFGLGALASGDAEQAISEGRVSTDAEGRKVMFNALGAGTAVISGAALIVGAALATMGDEEPRPVVSIGSGGATVGVAGAF